MKAFQVTLYNQYINIFATVVPPLLSLILMAKQFSYSDILFIYFDLLFGQRIWFFSYHLCYTYSVRKEISFAPNIRLFTLSLVYKTAQHVCHILCQLLDIVVQYLFARDFHLLTFIGNYFLLIWTRLLLLFAFTFGKAFKYWVVSVAKDLLNPLFIYCNVFYVNSN